MLLMKKNMIVAEISMINGSIYKINKVYDREFLPIGLYADMNNAEIEADETPLKEWWKNNSIPAQRDSIRRGIECIGITDVDELKLLSHGVSLLNDYWVKEENSVLKWEDVNFWINPFSKEIGEALFNHKPYHSDHSVIGTSPDGSLNGLLKKKWIIMDGEYYLQKSGTGLTKEEVFHEILGTEIMNAAGIPNAQYGMHFDDKEICCISKCFTSENTELVPFTQIIDVVERRVYPAEPEMEHVKNILRHFQVKDYEEYLNNLLCIDYILANTDRHYNNLALLYQQDTDTFSFSPVYDSGNCLWNGISTQNIDCRDDSIMARPFCNKNTFGTWKEQKEFITSYIDLKKEDLENALRHYVSNTKQYSEITKQRIFVISSGCYERAYLLQSYLKKKDIHIAEGCAITEEDIERFKNEIKMILRENLGEKQ